MLTVALKAFDHNDFSFLAYFKKLKIKLLIEKLLS
jgi:hypothetical protein